MLLCFFYLCLCFFRQVSLSCLMYYFFNLSSNNLKDLRIFFQTSVNLSHLRYAIRCRISVIFFCLLRSLVYSVCSQLLEKVMAQSVRRNVCPFLMHHKMVVCAAKEDKLHPNPPLLTTLFHRLIYPLVNVFPG